MRPHAIAIAAIAAAVSCGHGRQGGYGSPVFHTETVNPYTPVKSQGRNQTCWIYAMLSAIETEHIGRGDSVHLSPYYVERKLIEQSACRAYLSQGAEKISLRGTPWRLVGLIETWGVVPYDSYGRGEGANTTVLSRKVSAAVRTAVSARAGLDA